MMRATVMLRATVMIDLARPQVFVSTVGVFVTRDPVGVGTVGATR